MPSNAAIPIHLVVICGEVAVTQRVVNARIADNCASRQIVADNVLGIRMIGYHQGLGFCTFSPIIGTFDPVTTKGIVYTRRPPRVTDGYLLHNVRVRTDWHRGSVHAVRYLVVSRRQAGCLESSRGHSCM